MVQESATPNVWCESQVRGFAISVDLTQDKLLWMLRDTTRDELKHTDRRLRQRIRNRRSARGQRARR